MHHIRQRLCLDQLFVSWKRQFLRFRMRQERSLCRTRSILSPTEILFARGTIHAGIGDVNWDSADQSKCLTDAKNTMRVNSIEGKKPVVGIEPTTQRLRSACSTTELHRHEKMQPIYQDSDTVKSRSLGIRPTGFGPSQSLSSSSTVSKVVARRTSDVISSG